MSLLSVVRKHDYIQRSPAHSRAFVLSARGLVELHTKGLADFEPLGELNETMTKYTMATKLPLFAKFREYKTFRPAVCLAEARLRPDSEAVSRLQCISLGSDKEN